jgi:hypothetical protein
MRIAVPPAFSPVVLAPLRIHHAAGAWSNTFILSPPGGAQQRGTT